MFIWVKVETRSETEESPQGSSNKRSVRDVREGSVVFHVGRRCKNVAS